MKACPNHPKHLSCVFFHLIMLHYDNTKNALCKKQWHTPVTWTSGGWGRRIMGFKASHSYIGGHVSCWERGWLVGRIKMGRRRRKGKEVEEEQKGVYVIRNFIIQVYFHFLFLLFYYLREKQEKCLYFSHTVQHAASQSSCAMSWYQNSGCLHAWRSRRAYTTYVAVNAISVQILEVNDTLAQGRAMFFYLSIFYPWRYLLSQQPFSIFLISTDTTV